VIQSMNHIVVLLVCTLETITSSCCVSIAQIAAACSLWLSLTISYVSRQLAPHSDTARRLLYHFISILLFQVMHFRPVDLDEFAINCFY